MSSNFLPAVVDLTPHPSVTEEEAKQIWLSAKKPMVAMLIKTLWYTGLRITEALMLTAGDIMRDNLDFTLLVHSEKIGKKKDSKLDSLPIPRNLGLDIYDYIKSQNIKESELMFPMHRSTAWRKVQQCAEDAGLPYWRDIHPHSFRHGFIYDKAKKGVHPYVLSKLARHRDLKTTLGYYQPTENDLRQAMG